MHADRVSQVRHCHDQRVSFTPGPRHRVEEEGRGWIAGESFGQTVQNRRARTYEDSDSQRKGWDG
jgi:hypothetical protein